MNRHPELVLIASVILSVCSASPSQAEEPAPIAVLVETSDGSILAGTLPGNLELTLFEGEKETRIALRDVRRIAVSCLREKETAALEAEVKKLRDRLAADEVEEREAACEALLAMPGAVAPFVSRLTKDSDPEVVLRARRVLANLKSKRQLEDSRDLVVTDKGLFRGWLKLEKLEIRTSLGEIEVARAEIRTLAKPEFAEAAPGDKEEEWPPPLARQAPPAPPVLLVACLRDGSRLAGETSADSLALVDPAGATVASDHLISLVRDPDAPDFFQARRKLVPVFRARLAAKEIALSSASRHWKIPVELIQSIEIGPPRPGRRGGDAMSQLVQSFNQAVASGAEIPTQRFWVYIDGQPANPWNSEGKKGMTWSLLKVNGQACLVGADKLTDAYKGDTSIEEELPILCLHKMNLPAPEGVDPKDFYCGWSGGEIRLTRPVAGTELTSLEAANAIIKSEFGDDWEIGEHHSPSGGWHWWAYWGGVPDEGK